jgi:hypothetical protein
MTRNRVFQSLLISACVFLMTACANNRPPGYLDDKYFRAEAKYYEKFQLEGTTVYCATKDSHAGQGLMPYYGTPRCITEADLRLAVRDVRKGMQ